MKKALSTLMAVCMLILSMGISAAAENNSFAQVSNFEEFKAAIENPDVDTIELMDHIHFTEPLTLNKDITIGTWQQEAYMIKEHDNGPMFRVVGEDVTIRLVRNFEAQVMAFTANGGAGMFISANVNHLTIQDAHLSAFDTMVYMEKGDVTLDNCLCYNNYADPNLYWGPVVYSQEGNVTVKNSKVHDNAASDAAGALYVANGDVVIDNSTFENNRAYYYGGAMYVRNGNVSVINNSKITKNQSTAGAGGIHVEYGSVTIDSTSAVTGNNGPDGDVVVEHPVQ